MLWAYNNSYQRGERLESSISKMDHTLNIDCSHNIIDQMSGCGRLLWDPNGKWLMDFSVKLACCSSLGC